MTTTHHISGTSIITTCGMSTDSVHLADELVSIFTRDTTCPACLARIDKLTAIGKSPKY
jgi:hypothetical protein